MRNARRPDNHEAGRSGPSRVVLLLRGVNVGGHKKVAMADLRAMLERLGHTNVRTLLNSGNAVFDVAQVPVPATLRASVEAAIEQTFGFGARSFVLTASDLDAVVAENTLAASSHNPSRLMVAYFASPEDREKVVPLARQTWGEEGLAVGSRAAYVWCARSVLESELFDAVARALNTGMTTRNWATTLKLQALCRVG